MNSSRLVLRIAGQITGKSRGLPSLLRPVARKTQLTVTRKPVARGTGTEYLPILSESAFPEAVI